MNWMTLEKCVGISLSVCQENKRNLAHFVLIVHYHSYPPTTAAITVFGLDPSDLQELQ